jgi:hypothetical protein
MGIKLKAVNKHYLILGMLINFLFPPIIVLCSPAHLGHNQGYVERQKQKNNKITNNKITFLVARNGDR